MSERSAYTEKHWPDESESELVARIEREYGASMVPVILKVLAMDVPKGGPKSSKRMTDGKRGVRNVGTRTGVTRGGIAGRHTRGLG